MSHVESSVSILSMHHFVKSPVRFHFALLKIDDSLALFVELGISTCFEERMYATASGFGSFLTV